MLCCSLQSGLRTRVAVLYKMVCDGMRMYLAVVYKMVCIYASLFSTKGCSVVHMYTDVHFGEPAVSVLAVAVWDQGGSSWSQPLLWPSSEFWGYPP